MVNPQEFIKAVRNGVATVEFKKIGTDELRVMPCTLSSEIAGFDIALKDMSASSDHFVVWCIDKAAWRSFRVNTVTDWYPGYPEGYEL
jgi:hypothetical protein